MFIISTSHKISATNEVVWEVLSPGSEHEITTDSGIDVEVAASCTVSELTIPDWFEFQRLVALWHQERGATSSTTKNAICPSYQRIIAEGQRFLPLIFRQLEKEGDEPDHWFWALRVITGADPVPDADRGNIVEMSRAWLNFGREHYAW